MPDNAQILGLLSGALESGRTPEEVCAGYPEMLERVWLRREACRRVVAMAEYRMGRAQEARETFTKAVASFDWSPARTIMSDQREVWICHVLRRESEALILPSR